MPFGNIRNHMRETVRSLSDGGVEHCEHSPFVREDWGGHTFGVPVIRLSKRWVATYGVMITAESI